MTSETFTIRDQTYQVASWPLRIAAKAIDWGVCYGGVTFGVAFLHLLFPEMQAVVLMIVLLAASVWWWLVSDGLLHGAGLGKSMLGLRLVHRRHGSAPSQGQAALRQLKYSMFLSVWGLMAHAHDDRHGRSGDDGFVTVTVSKPKESSAAPESTAGAAPRPRPINVEALGSFLSDKYAHKDHAPPK